MKFKTTLLALLLVFAMGFGMGCAAIRKNLAKKLPEWIEKGIDEVKDAVDDLEKLGVDLVDAVAKTDDDDEDEDEKKDD